jgi:galactokinase
VYCSDMAREIRARVLEAFDLRFGGFPEILVRAPGRVNLLGAHVDYVEGWVLPGAIDRAVWLAARRRERGPGTVEALDLREVGELDPSRLPPPVPERESPASEWLDFPRGVAWALGESIGALPALDVVFASDVPIGAGLSSSAAVEVAFSMAWEAAAGREITDLERAKLGRRVENAFLGVGSGIMDQFASIHGRAGHLMLLDCRTLEHRQVPVAPGLAVLVADSGVRRTLAGSDYNDRPAECRQAAAILAGYIPGIRTLRDVTEEDLEAFGEHLPENLLLRARHAVAECRRVQHGARALEAGEVEAFGELIRASHRSSRDLYQISIPELDLLAETAWAADGCYGARLSGAGFGGCVTALVDADTIGDVAERLRDAFERHFGRPCVTWYVAIDDGAHCEHL